jgi:hypothetical protein
LPLEPNQATNQAIIWDKFGLHAIPEFDFADVFIRALGTLEDGTNFGAPHILTAWYAIKRERASQTETATDRAGLNRSFKPSSELCYLCQDTGWQTFAYKSDTGNENTAVRACGCIHGKKTLIAHELTDYMRKHQLKDVPKDWAPDPRIAAEHKALLPPQWRKRAGTEIWEPNVGPADRFPLANPHKQATFAEWFEQDGDWIKQTLTPATQAKMKEIFDKRTAGEPQAAK